MFIDVKSSEVTPALVLQLHLVRVKGTNVLNSQQGELWSKPNRNKIK